MDTKISKESFLDRIKRRAFDHPIIAVIVIVAGTLVATGNALDAWSKIEIAVGLKPDALYLAGESQRSAFSRDLTRLAWRRLFWARNYLERVQRDASTAMQDEAWNRYNDTVQDWTAELVNIYGQLREYYGPKGKFEQFRDKIHGGFQDLNNHLIAVRYPKRTDGADSEFEKAQSAASNLNVEMCQFVSGLKDRSKSESACY